MRAYRRPDLKLVVAAFGANFAKKFETVTMGIFSIGEDEECGHGSDIGQKDFAVTV